MCSALLRFGSFPHHNEVGALVVFSKSAMPRLYGNGMCCSSICTSHNQIFLLWQNLIWQKISICKSAYGVLLKSHCNILILAWTEAMR